MFKFEKRPIYQDWDEARGVRTLKFYYDGQEFDTLAEAQRARENRKIRKAKK